MINDDDDDDDDNDDNHFIYVNLKLSGKEDGMTLAMICGINLEYIRYFEVRVARP
jgi:hypothetical protein